MRCHTPNNWLLPQNGPLGHLAVCLSWHTTHTICLALLHAPHIDSIEVSTHRNKSANLCIHKLFGCFSKSPAFSGCLLWPVYSRLTYFSYANTIVQLKIDLFASYNDRKEMHQSAKNADPLPQGVWRMVRRLA
jgi:hypothetical protein